MRGDRIGIIGNNGVGKTTLLRILLGQLAPDLGSVKIGTNLTIGYFDQVRDGLEWDKSVAFNVANGKDHISMNGGDRHVIGYLKGFLFTPERARTAIKHLSGGEVNRVLLAEAVHANQQPDGTGRAHQRPRHRNARGAGREAGGVQRGTLIVVSHDRDFVDNVVTSTLVFEENNRLIEYQGGFSDWASRGRQLAVLEQRPGEWVETSEAAAEPATSSEPEPVAPNKPASSKRNSATSFSASSMRCQTPLPSSKPKSRS